MTSSLMSSPPISISHCLFQCRYLYSRDVAASSPSFSHPATGAPQRACSKASSGWLSPNILVETQTTLDWYSTDSWSSIEQLLTKIVADMSIDWQSSEILADASINIWSTNDPISLQQSVRPVLVTNLRRFYAWLKFEPHFPSWSIGHQFIIIY